VLVSAVLVPSMRGPNESAVSPRGGRQRRYARSEHRVTNTSAPIREGNFIAWYGTYESMGQAAARILNVVSQSDSKVVDQWVYPAP
jgi:hypothetical protein